MDRRGFIAGIAAALVIPKIARANVIPFQQLTIINGITVDPQSLLIYWGPFQAGDEGIPISVFACDRWALQFTGYPFGNNNSNPNVPIMTDRSLTMLVTDDNKCWGQDPEFPPFYATDPTARPPITPGGMNDRTNDPTRVSRSVGAHMLIKPQVSGGNNPQGPDCGLLMFCSKLHGPRS